MATRKKKTQTKKRQTRKKPAANVALPEGYTAVAGFGDSWPGTNPEVGATLIGEIVGYDEVEVRRGRKIEETNTMRVEDEDGKVWTVWESAGLRPLFEYEEGTHICIIFTGMGKAKKGQNAPKLYNIGVLEA